MDQEKKITNSSSFYSGKSPSEAKHIILLNTSAKLKSPVAQKLKLHGTCDRKVLNLKQTRLYSLNANQTKI